MKLIPINKDSVGFLIPGPGMAVFPIESKIQPAPSWSGSVIWMPNSEDYYWSELSVDEVRAILEGDSE